MKFRIRSWNHSITWFIATQICILLLIIYRENRFIAQLYKLQKCEQRHQTLLDTHKRLTHKLHQTKSVDAAKLYASQHPHLKPIPLSAVRDIHDQRCT